MTAEITEILEELIKNTDLSIIAYLANIVDEGIKDKSIKTHDDVYSMLKDPISMYDISTSNENSLQLCRNIFTKLIENEYVIDPKKLKNDTLSKLKIGSKVMAQFTEDRTLSHYYNIL